MSHGISLNDAQRAAVEHPPGPLLVIAGAGSGKTRVLTARVARMLELGTPADAVLAFTFTNRAAREMRARIGSTVGDAAARLWAGTFHGTGARILRREAARGTLTEVPPDFTIYDREDQETVLREVMKALELPEAYRLGDLLARISDAKNALVTSAEAERAAVTPYEQRVAQAFARYQAELRRRGALDFDDLIAAVVRLFLERPEVHERYARKFEHVLVDEYQDTNHAQFRLVAALGSVHRSLFAVGDEDQSIYRWRGADLSNVLDFETHFPGAAVLRLEQNYRSTGNILKAANAVIANNRDRKGKTLWCDREDGPRLRFILAADEIDEAKRIASRLAERVRRGGALADAAVLYRTNAQSRALETELRQRGMKYEIVGGISFYQRREVKDVLAYLRVVVNPADLVAFWRAWNTPRRGLGDAVRARVEQRLAEGAPNALEALRDLMRAGDARGRAGAEEFLGLIDELRARVAEPAHVLMTRVVERAGYFAMLDELPGPEAADRAGNVDELLVSAQQFAQSRPDAGLAEYLVETALLTDADRLEEGTDRVLLLTAHNAKGLEFPLVIVAGLEEGLMPHASSLEDPAELEEERRLFYVALTRARDEVLLTAAAYRRRFDGSRGGQVSRFVGEIPEELLEREDHAAPAWSHASSSGAHWPAWSADRATGARPARRGSTTVEDAGRSGPAYRTSGALAKTVGQEVFHDAFGRGVVVAAEGEGSDVKFTVRFGTRIVKVLGRFLTGGTDVD